MTGASAIETGAGRAARSAHRRRSTLPADLVVLGLGVRPNVALPATPASRSARPGGVVVDRRMRTPAEGVWAAGDCVESVHRLSGQRRRVALGTHANKQGRVAGINIGGGYATFPGVIGTAVTKVCDLEVARTGLSMKEADAAGYATSTAHVDSTTRAGYFPGAKPIRVKLLAEKRRRAAARRADRRPGGCREAHRRARHRIWNEMTVDEVLALDLSYAPPFAPVWDPVLIAARKAFEAVEADVRPTSARATTAEPPQARRHAGPQERTGRRRQGAGLPDHVARDVGDQLELARAVAHAHAAVGAHAHDGEVGPRRRARG